MVIQVGMIQFPSLGLLPQMKTETGLMHFLNMRLALTTDLVGRYLL